MFVSPASRFICSRVWDLSFRGAQLQDKPTICVGRQRISLFYLSSTSFLFLEILFLFFTIAGLASWRFNHISISFYPVYQDLKDHNNDFGGKTHSSYTSPVYRRPSFAWRVWRPWSVPTCVRQHGNVWWGNQHSPARNGKSLIFWLLSDTNANRLSTTVLLHSTTHPVFLRTCLLNP